MLIESTAHLPISLAMFQDVFNAPGRRRTLANPAAMASLRSRYHLDRPALLFQSRKRPVQKGLDAETKKKVNPDLLGRALWYFRWGAVVTVLAGLMYFAMVILKADVTNAKRSEAAASDIWYVLLCWMLYPIVLFAIEFLLIKKVPAVTKDGRVFAIVMFVLVGNLYVWTRQLLHFGVDCRHRELRQ